MSGLKEKQTKTVFFLNALNIPHRKEAKAFFFCTNI